MRENFQLNQEVWGEADLCELLVINKASLAGLRNTKGLPYVRVNTRCRVYLASSIFERLEILPPMCHYYGWHGRLLLSGTTMGKGR